MSSKNDYQVLFSYLRSLNFHFLETWVIECVNYYKTSNANISLDVLKREVKQQWLLVDLRELKVPSLPPDLKSRNKIILEGKYAVQVESMIDCSRSCYSQFRELRKINDENIEATKEDKKWDLKSKRCLTFGISDGVQEIFAMEYKPIKKIRTNDPELLPGFKMIITGPVECRKGMLLLKDENVTVCGGEVDTLTTSNTLKSILIRKLNLDEEGFQDEASPVFESAQLDNFNSGNVASLLSENEDLFLSLPLETEILTQTGETINSQNLSIEIDNVSQSGINRKHSITMDLVEAPKQKKLSLDPEMEGNYLPFRENAMDIQEAFLNVEPVDGQSNFKSGAPKVKEPVQVKLSPFFQNNYFSNKRTFVDHTPICVSERPFVYLKQIISSNVKKPSIFTVKVIILTLKKKIGIEHDEFSLRANITDGSLCVDVNFSSEILENLLGFSPCEMAAMMKVKHTNSAIAERIKESFSKAQRKLISLNCLMNVNFCEGKPPLVLSLREVTAEHLDALHHRRLNDS